MPPILEIRDLEITGPAGPILSSVGFALDPGECVCIVGESGCGKSLTALAIFDLLPPGLRITGGSMRFDNHDLLEKGVRKKLRGRDFGMIFQEPASALNPVYTIGFQIGEVLRHLDRKTRRDTVADLLRRVGLEPSLANDCPHQLSGGMKQRAMIAMALAGNPRMLVCDEPTTALDPTVGAQILSGIRALTSEGIGIVLITHDFHAVSRMGGQLVVMYAGCVVETGGVKAVLENPAHPYTRALLDALPQRGGPLNSIPGQVPPPGMRPPGCPFSNRCALVLSCCEAEPAPWAPVAHGGRARCHRLSEREGGIQT